MAGLLVVISGFSGVGKGTLVKRLLENEPERYALSVSATSRLPRKGEVDGREYFFKTPEQFREMVENDELLEHATYNGSSYGTPKQYVFDRIARNQNVILEIDVQGALQIKKKYPEALLIFVLPPDAATLRDRLLTRGTETPENVRKRLSLALQEADYIPAYDNVIVNDDLDECYGKLCRIINENERRPFKDKRYLKKMIKDLKSILEE